MKNLTKFWSRKTNEFVLLAVNKLLCEIPGIYLWMSEYVFIHQSKNVTLRGQKYRNNLNLRPRKKLRFEAESTFWVIWHYINVNIIAVKVNIQNMVNKLKQIPIDIIGKSDKFLWLEDIFSHG